MWKDNSSSSDRAGTISRVHECPESILFVNCDEPLFHEIEHPLETILETYRTEIYANPDAVQIFDEIQSIHGWESVIKSWYDCKTYTILLSGSSSALLNANLSRLIAGRYLPVSVYPPDFAEFLSIKNIPVETKPLKFSAKRFTYLQELKKYMETGGFPGVVKMTGVLETPEQTIGAELLAGYYHSIMYRDIEGNHPIRNPAALHELTEYLLANIAVPFSYQRLAKTFGLEAGTVKEYLSFAKEAFLMYEVRQFSYSLKTQAAAQKKIYAADTGMRNSVAFSFSRDEGRLVENIVFLSFLSSGFEPYFWKRGGEGNRD
ncbi:MAG TPA: ATP-binding protein [Methanocorpusculum sp.]|nr:ATP-binding protein [Methanocorpusculum sp.]